MGLEDKQVLISGGVIAVFGIAVVVSLLIAPSYSGKDTQFFVTNTVNATDISLNDLTDVLLINTLNKQILVYNSTSNLWENENQTSISTNNSTCSNLGSGKILCASYSGNNLAFKSLLAGNGITLSNDTNTITITNTGVLHNIAGTGISVNQTSGNVLITNTLPESTVCNNATSSAGHKGLCKDNTIDLRTLLAGSGISLSLNSTDITITNSGVTSITANSPISASASTGSVTLSCPTCMTTADTNVFQQLAQCQSNASATTFSCTFTAKQHLYFDITGKTQTSTSTWGIRFNNDAGSNYLQNGITFSSATYSNTQDASAQTSCAITFASSVSNGAIFQGNLFAYNFASGNTKGYWGNIYYGTDASIPRAETTSCNWANTSTQINRIDFVRLTGTGTLTSGEITVWGYN